MWIHMYMKSCTWIHIHIHIWIHKNYEFIWFFHIRIHMFHEFIYESGCTKVPDVGFGFCAVGFANFGLCVLIFKVVCQAPLKDHSEQLFEIRCVAGCLPILSCHTGPSQGTPVRRRLAFNLIGFSFMSLRHILSSSS